MTPLPREVRNALGRFTSDGRSCVTSCTSDPKPGSEDSPDTPPQGPTLPPRPTQQQTETPKEIQAEAPHQLGFTAGSEETTCALSGNSSQWEDKPTD